MQINDFKYEQGPLMAAKESKYIEDEKLKIKFHEVFCRTQIKAGTLAM